MLERLFESVLGMTLASSAVIILVLIARLALRRGPRVFSYALWAVVLARLIIPFTIQSPLSLIPSARILDVPGINRTEAHILEVSTGIDSIDEGLNEYLSAHPYSGYVPGKLAPSGPLPAAPEPDSVPDWRTVPALIWAFGGIAMLVYSGISLLLLRRRLVGAVPLEGEAGVLIADRAGTPFVLGFFRPRIYLPSDLPQQERGFVLLHERTHIRRLDHVTRFLAWLALCVHWFNPLVWLAFRLAGRDMEVSCDEAALRLSGGDIRADYASALLRLSSGERLPVGPLAFGDGDPEGRIKNVLSYKKPAFWVIVVSLVAVIAAAAALITARPFARPESPFGSAYTASDYLYRVPSEKDAGLDTYALVSPDTLRVSSPMGETFDVALEPISLRGRLEEYRDHNWWTGGRDLISSIRRGNYAAWWGHTAGDSRFWYLLQQKDGSLYLASGLYDAEGETDPASDDSTIHWIVRLNEASEVPDAGLPPFDCRLEVGRVLIAGLECDGIAMWVPPDADGVAPLGMIYLTAPAFLNDHFRASLEVLCARWTDESKTALRVYFITFSSSLAKIAAVPPDFTADLASGTVTVDNAPPSRFGEHHTFTDAEMLSMSRTLSRLIIAAEQYYSTLPQSSQK